MILETGTIRNLSVRRDAPVVDGIGFDLRECVKEGRGRLFDNHYFQPHGIGLLDPAQGQLRWYVETKPWSRSLFGQAGDVFTYGRVFHPGKGNINVISRIDEERGEVIWSTKGTFDMLSAVTPEGNLLVLEWDMTPERTMYHDFGLRVLSRHDGSTLWEHGDRMNNNASSPKPIFFELAPGDYLIGLREQLLRVQLQNC